jgi:hypothetical protein
MLNESLKRIEDNSVSLLNMRIKKEAVNLKTDIKEVLVELFGYERTMLSDPTLNRLVRHIANYIKDTDINRQNADDILLMTLRQLGMEKLIEAYKEMTK